LKTGFSPLTTLFFFAGFASFHGCVFENDNGVKPKWLEADPSGALTSDGDDEIGERD